MAAIFFFSSLHSAPLPPGVTDKPAHAIGYFGFGVVIARALGGGFPPRLTLRQVLVGIVFASLYAVSDEYHQSFVAGRTSDVADWFADTTGASLSLFACWAWTIIGSRSRQPAAGSRQ